MDPAATAQLVETFTTWRRQVKDTFASSSADRREATLSLTGIIASLEPILDSAALSRRFMGIAIGSRSRSESAARAVLGVFCEADPAGVTALLCTHASVLSDFFRDSDRLLAWFGHFRPDGQHQHGARSLASYSMAHRDEAWSLLTWAGKHPQSPISCAQRPQLFCELDAVRSARRMIEEHGGRFLLSEEVQGGMRGGGLVQMEPEFFVKKLQRRLQDGDRTIENALRSFLSSCPVRPLAQRAFLLLSDTELLDLLEGAVPDEALDGSKALSPSLRLQARLFTRKAAWRSLGDLLACHVALTSTFAGGSGSGPVETLASGAKRFLRTCLPLVAAASATATLGGDKSSNSSSQSNARVEDGTRRAEAVAASAPAPSAAPPAGGVTPLAWARAALAAAAASDRPGPSSSTGHLAAVRAAMVVRFRDLCSRSNPGPALAEYLTGVLGIPCRASAGERVRGAHEPEAPSGRKRNAAGDDGRKPSKSRKRRRRSREVEGEEEEEDPLGAGLDTSGDGLLPLPADATPAGIIGAATSGPFLEFPGPLMAGFGAREGDAGCLAGGGAAALQLGVQQSLEFALVVLDEAFASALEPELASRV